MVKTCDRNTKYFHQRANRKQRRNWLFGLNDEHGVQQESKSRMERVVVDCFSKLFVSQGGDGIEEVLTNILPVVSNEMNEDLIRPVCDEEIK